MDFVGLTPISRCLPQHCCRTVVGGTTRVSSIKLAGVNLTVDASGMGSFFTASTKELTKLRILKATVPSSFFRFIAAQTNLRFLELKDIEIGDEDDGELDLSFVRSLHKLETLIIDDCHKLTGNGLHVLLELPELKRLVLGIEALTQLSDKFCEACSIDFTLILYGPRCSNDRLKLQAIHSLTHLKFVDFWAIEYPFWIGRLPRLESLSFAGGYLNGGKSGFDITLPTRLKHLSCLSCRVDRQVLNGILGSAGNLKTLEHDLPHFAQDISISRCTDLSVLRVSAKECDGEILERLVDNKNLHVVELGGCQNLTLQHLVILDSFRHLTKICISSSSLGNGCCEQLASLSGIQHLEFHCCLGIVLDELQHANGLRSLVLDKCMSMQGDINAFLLSPLTQGLNALRIEDF